MRTQHRQVHPPRGRDCSPPARGVDLAMLCPHSHPARAGPPPYTGGARLQGVQRSVSLEYQTCTSAYLFDTLVTGKAAPRSWTGCSFFLHLFDIARPVLQRVARVRVLSLSCFTTMLLRLTLTRSAANPLKQNTTHKHIRKPLEQPLGCSGSPSLG